MKTPEQNNQNQNPNINPRFKRRFWIWYLLAFALIAVFIGTFVTRYTNKVNERYTDADMTLTYNEGSEKTIENVDWSKSGKLANILWTSNVTSLQYADHSETNYREIVGSYTVTTNNKTSTIRFSAVLGLNNVSRTNFDTILSSRTLIKPEDGKSIYYYSGDYPIVNVVDYTTQNSWTSYIPTIIMWVVIIGIGVYLVSRLSKSMNSAIGQANRGMDFNSSRARKETNTKVKFKDVAGCDEVKAELVELVDYFKNAKAYTRLGAKLPRGFLLVGPPGTGKTLLAKAVAGEANVPFYSISGSDFVEMYVGVGAGRVRDMFRVAKQNAPCLIFIDEIDAVGRQRGAGLGGGNDEREQTLNQLLVEMDGFEDNSGVIVMAATNRADVLDPALTRAGRFDRQITVDLPDKEGREAILKVHARNKIVSNTVDFGAIANRTVGFSGADLANILNDAAILAVREKKNAIDMDDIDEAIDRSIAGPAKSNKGMSEEEKRRVAYHESGHAVIGIRLQHSEKVQRITIIPRGRTGGHVLMTPESDRFVLTKSELMAQITGLLGGRTSEELFFGDVSTGASNDIEQATRIARAMVVEYGMSDLGPIQYERNTGSVFLGRDYNNTQANYSTQVAYEIDKAVRSIIDECHEQCLKLLTKYKDDVELIAKTLIEHETITAEQIDYLLANRKLPEKPQVVKTEEVNLNKPEDPTNISNTETKKEEKETGLESKVETPVVEVKEDENKKQFNLDKAGLDLQSKLPMFSEHASLIVLFCEVDDGEVINTRKAKKIISDATNSLIARTEGIGETVSDKIAKQGVILTVKKSTWTQFYDKATDFGQYVEDTTGVEVIYVPVEPNSFAKIEEMVQGTIAKAVKKSKIVKPTSSTINKDVEKTIDDLKDSVNKSDDQNKKDQ